MRVVSVMAVLCLTTGCVEGATGPARNTFDASSPEAFAGSWRSVSPSLEFVGLSLASLSSEMGVLGARLTFSGVEWEGRGRIEGDSLVAIMTRVGTTTAGGVIVAHARDTQTLRALFAPATAMPLQMTFARER